MSLLEVNNLKVAYPHQSQLDPIWAIDDISFTLDSGSRLGLVGESGCGKSTIGKTIMSLLPDQSQIAGEIKFQGKSV